MFGASRLVCRGCGVEPYRLGPVVLSVLVLVGFAAMLWLVISEKVPANQRDMVTLLLGTLAGTASGVVACWVGSSSGAAQKNAAPERTIVGK